MSKIKQAFTQGKAFIPFLTIGDPNPEKTVEFALALADAGADLIELGVPFSDPVAEGSVIQEASVRALQVGTTTETAFRVVRDIRKQSQIPLVFLLYLNTVFHYGYERFFQVCQEIGLDGVIIPDLPLEEREEVATVAGSYGVDIISLIAPTSKGRIQSIAEKGEGFLYLVSSMGVTGVRKKIETDLTETVKAIRGVTDCPLAVGFGISTPAQAREMAALSDGAIVGSAIVKIVAEHGEGAVPYLTSYAKAMKAAVTEASL